MRRTTIKIPDELDFRLREEAAQRGVAISDVTRAALESYLNRGPRQLLAAGAGASGHKDISERIDEILQREWVGDC